MAFFYHTATNARSLAEHLFPLLREERQRLKPQTPQTITIANADGEAFLTREFLLRDRILMAVNFPYLEAALDNLALRLLHAQKPSASETFFSVPHLAGNTPTFSGLLEVELIVLALQQEKKHARIFSDLGYDPEVLSAMQRVLLARKLAGKLREYLLHVPHLMHSEEKRHPLLKLWRTVAAALAQHGHFSPLHHHDRFRAMIAEMNARDFEGHGALFLFAMPLLSAYHISILSAVARHVDVHLLTVDATHCPAPLDAYAKDAREKFTQYKQLLHQATEKAGSSLSCSVYEEGNKAPLTLPRIAVWGMPGKWRSAEIICDDWHEQLLRYPELSQEDIALSTTKPEEDFTAFELSGALRQLTVFTRQKLLQRTDALVALFKLVSDAASGGITRMLLTEYFTNTAVRNAFHLSADEAALYTRMLETTHAYRDDFPGSMETYNISSALRRMRRGLVIGALAPAGVPGFAHIPELDSEEMASHFSAATGFLLSAAERLKASGAPLIDAVTDMFSSGAFSDDPAAAALVELVRRVGVHCTDETLSITQLAAIVGEYTPEITLPQGHSSEGICISSLASSLFVKPKQVIFNCDESMDGGQDDVADEMQEYVEAATRLSPQLQLRIHLLAALLSGCETLLFAYAASDPLTGAEKYAAHEIEILKAAFMAAGTAIDIKSDFSQSTLISEGSDDPPPASDGDRQCALLLRGGEGSEALSDFLRPASSTAAPEAEVISLAVLEKFIENPAAAILSESGVLPEDPIDFRRDEPRLSPSEKARLKFCDDYLTREIFSPEPDITGISAHIKQNQENGSAPPDSFDAANILVAQHKNAERLQDFALAEKNATRLIEFHFHRGVDQPFAVMDNARLERRYLPAVKIGTRLICGKSPVFLMRQSTEEITLVDSAIYPERSSLLVRAHLLYCLLLSTAAKDLIPKAIAIGDYAIPKSSADQGILQPEFHLRAALKAETIHGAEEYLTKLITHYESRALFWFDLDSLAKNKLAGLAEADAEKIRDQLESPQSESRHDFLRRFYDLKIDADSIGFFDNFIRPVALIDAESELKPKKGKKRG
ncbi:MAG: exodeoxyribonuclease V subunit gamma [Leptospiraceae bacterium]|nr:exodeoxyribonuclease V subunit gamma [Leptospiraceae bacterium]